MALIIKRACYVDPMKQRVSHDEIVFAEWFESIRKDECAFGILKMRCRILFNRFEFHSLAFVCCIFRCCAILHNMLVRWDGRDVSSMTTETEEGKEIGLGLFAGINYRSTQKIAYFRGDIIPLETYDKRQNQRFTATRIRCPIIVGPSVFVFTISIRSPRQVRHGQNFDSSN